MKNVLKPKLYHFKKYTLDLDFYVFVMFFVFITVKVKRWVTKA